MLVRNARRCHDLWVLTATTFDVPSEWREWLGSIRADEVAGSNQFLVSKLASATPDVLDGENQSLQQRVWHFYVGLLLSVMFSPSHKPVMLTGARRDGVIGARQQRDLERPAPQILPRYPPIVADDILLAAQLGQKLDAMSPVTVPGGLWRLFRTLNIYVETRAIGQLVDRVHQYCRLHRWINLARYEAMKAMPSGGCEYQFNLRRRGYRGSVGNQKPTTTTSLGKLGELKRDALAELQRMFLRD